METIVFAGGCFWCTEAVFTQIRGVQEVIPGYTGGKTPHPTYDSVCGGTTGHAESVQVTFDPSVVSLKDLLDVFFATHDPTTLNRQGADVGTQYRSAIFYTTDKQREAIDIYITEVDPSNSFTTEVSPLAIFYPAEKEHYNYFEQHPERAYCQVVINPKVQKIQERFQKLVDMS